MTSPLLSRRQLKAKLLCQLSQGQSHSESRSFLREQKRGVWMVGRPNERHPGLHWSRGLHRDVLQCGNWLLSRMEETEETTVLPVADWRSCQLTLSLARSLPSSCLPQFLILPFGDVSSRTSAKHAVPKVWGAFRMAEVKFFLDFFDHHKLSRV